VNEITRPILTPDLDSPSLTMRQDLNSFSDRVIRSVLPNQQVRNFFGIVQHLSHNPRRQQRNLFAVYPAPEKPTVCALPGACAPPHHQFLVTIKPSPFILNGSLLKNHRF
jgi:hypothetical protein